MILAVIFVLLVSQIQLFAQGGTWVTKTSMPTPRNQHSANIVNGVVYVVGGCTGNGSCVMVAAVDAYNPASDTWASKAPIPTVRADLSTSVVNGILYAIGGTNVSGSGSVGTVEAYDPISDTWTTKTSMPTARARPSTSVVNGVIYAIGGANGTGVLGTVEAYDPASDTWTTKTSIPTGFYFGSTSVVNGIIYALGGNNGASPAVGTVGAYDPASDTWTTKAAMPTARSGLGSSAVNGVIYAIGGVDPNSVALGIVEAYDPTSDTWATKASMPTARYNFSTSVVNGVVYGMGGNNGTTISLATNEAFAPPLPPPLVGDGSAITNLTAANISPGTAGINITGNAGTATSASGLTCTGCVGNTQLGVNYAGSASQAGPANSALIAGLASQATNSLSLGGVLATAFARLDIGNGFTGNQNVAGNLAITGVTALGSGGTPILKHLSLTFDPTFPALKAHDCRSENFTFTGASDGDTIALGVPNSRMTGGGTLNYFAWVGAGNTITIRACNINPIAKQKTAGSGAIRVDVWKH
jgi:N-acetylneuraminic acid mutarotase